MGQGSFGKRKQRIILGSGHLFFGGRTGQGFFIMQSASSFHEDWRRPMEQTALSLLDQKVPLQLI